MEAKLSSIHDLASLQLSLVTRQQLLGSGFTRHAIARLLRTGALRRVRPGIYATVGSARDWRRDLMAAVLAAGPGTVASHASAARLWSFVHRPEATVDVLYLGGFATRPPGVHRTTILPREDVAVRAGIPCTSFERTLCDCTTLLTAHQLGRVLDDGIRRGDASLTRLRRCAARLDSGPRRKLGIVKELLAHRDASFDPGGSASELHVLEVIRNAGLAEPVQQHAVRASGRSYVLDFAWPKERVFVEYYGLAVHSGASAVAHDSRRLTALVGQGWRPLIFTDSTSDREIVEAIASALQATPTDHVLAPPLTA